MSGPKTPTTCAFKQILCCVDLSEDSRHALEWAVAVAGGQGAEITILNVCPLAPLPVSDLPMPDELYRASDVDEAHARIAPFLEFVKRARIEARAHIEIGHPAAVIAAHAKALQSDLVVIGTHGRSGFNRLVLGSVAEKVLRSVGCPALTVPPRAHSSPRSSATPCRAGTTS